MQVSAEADEIVREIRALRNARQARLARDLSLIDAEYDRRVRRIQTGSLGGTFIWSCPFSSPACVRRFRRGVRVLRRIAVVRDGGRRGA